MIYNKQGSMINLNDKSEFLNFEPDLALQGYYQFEGHQVKVDNLEDPVHLYPTDKVKSTFSQYLKENPKDFIDGRLSLRQSATERISNKLNQSVTNLRRSSDTTMHYDATWLKENAVVDIYRNQLRKGNKKLLLCDGLDRMFVLNNNKELVIASKQRNSTRGRIHHSSLSGEENPQKTVYAAGIIKATQYPRKKARLVVTNVSGHYTPKPETLDRVVDWLKIKNVVVNTTSDSIEHNSSLNCEIRTLTLDCDLSNCINNDEKP